MPVVSDKYRGTTEYALVLGELVRAAEYRGRTTYQDIALLVGLPQKGQHMGREIGLILGAISEDEVRASRPMLSAVAVNVNGHPGTGFFELARDLGRLDQNDEELTAFWEAELKNVYKAWRRRLPEA